MQHPDNFKRSFITRFTCGAVLHLLGSSGAWLRMVGMVRDWYWRQLCMVYSGEQEAVPLFPTTEYLGQRAPWRVSVMVGLMHLLAVQPGLVMCGMLTVFLWPCYVLLFAVLRLGQLLPHWF